MLLQISLTCKKVTIMSTFDRTLKFIIVIGIEPKTGLLETGHISHMQWPFSYIELFVDETRFGKKQY